MKARVWARRVFLLLPIAFVTLFLVLPLAFMLVVSFWKRSVISMRPAFVLANYADFLTGTRLPVLGRSFLISIEATAIGLLIAYPIAYFLARKAQPSWMRAVLLLFTVPFLVNYIIRTFAWAYLLGRTGPINALLMALGLSDGPVDWLLFSQFAVLIGMVSSYMPFMIFPLWMSIAGIDKRLIEAAKDLGAGRWRTFRRITVPLTMPGIVIGCLLVFIPLMGEYLVPSILGGARSFMIGNLIGDEFISAHDWAFGSALAMGVILILLVLITIYFRAARRVTSAELAL